MQGKKLAHKFLAVLQEQVVEEGFAYSHDLMFSIAKNIGLDLDMFKEDYSSDLTKKIYKKNLQLAAEMKVKTTPSLVIFKDGDDEEAVRLNKQIESEMLHSICGKEQAAKPKVSVEQSLEREIEQNILKLNCL